MEFVTVISADYGRDLVNDIWADPWGRCPTWNELSEPASWAARLNLAEKAA